MAPPHLHPRSRMTSSLFATTVFASFLVVALPHLLPCPAPRRVFADDGSGEMPRRRRRRRAECDTSAAACENGDRGALSVTNGTEEGGRRMVEFRPGAGEAEVEGDERRRKAMGSKRECPVPKPGGVLGLSLIHI